MKNETDILIYQTEDGNTKIDVRLENETVWMTQRAIAELYQKGVNTINEHIKNIYAYAKIPAFTIYEEKLPARWKSAELLMKVFILSFTWLSGNCNLNHVFPTL